MARVFETVFERVAGLDVHKAQVTGCVRIPEGAALMEGWKVPW